MSESSTTVPKYLYCVTCSMSPALNVVMVERSGDVEDFPLLKVMGFVYVVFKTRLFLTDCSECSRWSVIVL